MFPTAVSSETAIDTAYSRVYSVYHSSGCHHTLLADTCEHMGPVSGFVLVPGTRGLTSLHQCSVRVSSAHEQTRDYNIMCPRLLLSCVNLSVVSEREPAHLMDVGLYVEVHTSVCDSKPRRAVGGWSWFDVPTAP